MQEIQCPQCGDWLGVPPEYANKPVRCGSCQRVIEPAERRAPPSPPPADRGPRFPDREDDPTLHRPPRKPGAVLWVWAVLAVLGLGCCGCGGVGLLFWAATNPEWKPFTPEKGEFTADFPGKPVYESKAFTGADGATGTWEQWTAWRLGNLEGFAVAFVDLPRSMRVLSDQTLLRLILEDFRKNGQPTFTEAASSDITVGKFKGKDVEGKINDPQHGEGYQYARVVIAGDRVFLLVARGKDQAKLTAEKDRFFNSFQPAEPKAKEKAK